MVVVRREGRCHGGSLRGRAACRGGARGLPGTATLSLWFSAATRTCGDLFSVRDRCVPQTQCCQAVRACPCRGWRSASDLWGFPRNRAAAGSCFVDML